MTSEELGRLGDALRLAENEGLPWETDGNSKHLAREENRRAELDPFPEAAIRLLILTGARLREILHARWEQVDIERGLLNLADSKTGKKSIYRRGLASERQKYGTRQPRLRPITLISPEKGLARTDCGSITVNSSCRCSIQRALCIICSSSRRTAGESGCRRAACL